MLPSSSLNMAYSFTFKSNIQIHLIVHHDHKHEFYIFGVYHRVCFVFQVYDIPPGQMFPAARNQGVYDVPPPQMDPRTQGVYDIPPSSQGVRKECQQPADLPPQWEGTSVRHSIYFSQIIKTEEVVAAPDQNILFNVYWHSS